MIHDLWSFGISHMYYDPRPLVQVIWLVLWSMIFGPLVLCIMIQDLWHMSYVLWSKTFGVSHVLWSMTFGMSHMYYDPRPLVLWYKSYVLWSKTFGIRLSVICIMIQDLWCLSYVLWSNTFVASHMCYDPWPLVLWYKSCIMIHDLCCKSYVL